MEKIPALPWDSGAQGFVTVMVWAEHFKVHTQKNQGAGVFFFPKFCAAAHSDQNKSQYFPCAEHSQLLTTGL